MIQEEHPIYHPLLEPASCSEEVRRVLYKLTGILGHIGSMWDKDNLVNLTAVSFFCNVKYCDLFWSIMP